MKPPKVFIFLLLLSLMLRLLPVIGDNTAFTSDQGRDMIDLRSLVSGGHPTLIGPTTSLNGVYLGPFLYYFFALPYLLGTGNPMAIVYWQIFWYTVAGIIVLRLLVKTDSALALAATGLFLLLPVSLSFTRFSWGPNLMPVFIVFFLLLLTLPREDTSDKERFVLGFIAGIALQIEAALGIILFPFTFLVLIRRRESLKGISLAATGFFITLLPQLWFEFRHGQIMTRTLLAEVSSRDHTLGNRLPVGDNLLLHLQTFSDMVQSSLPIPSARFSNVVFITLFVLIIIWLFILVRRYQMIGLCQRLFLSSVGMIIFAFFFYLFYPYPLKWWYLTGLTVPCFFILAIAITQLWHQRHNLVALFLLVIFIGTITLSVGTEFIRIVRSFNQFSDDPSNLKNQLATIDWVYHRANGSGFTVYDYIPSVYDYPYQYLFWWYGPKMYGYQPAVITYLPEVPEYITRNGEYWTRQKMVTPQDPVYLIVETSDQTETGNGRLSAWLAHFTTLCPQRVMTFPWKTEVFTASDCNKFAKN